MAASFPVNTEPPLHSPIEYRANGEISRMRSHKGNMPSLPQNKFCSLCPAKFTRTTHLNRHLRSHTNERSHKCDACSAEFTRSDLLTRHKRTCGDSRNSHKSRRKSCQSCAESKVKCNLQFPCSKCVARGRECVFINDPETSRSRKGSKRSPSTASRPGIRIDPESTYLRDSTSPLYSQPQTSSLPSPQSPYTMVYPSPIMSSPIHPSPVSTNQPETNIPFGLPSLCYSSSSSASSSRSSSRLEPFDLIPNLANLNFEVDLTESHSRIIDDFFPLQTHGHRPDHGTTSPYLNAFDPCSNVSEERTRADLASGNGGDLCSGIGNDESFSYHQPVHVPPPNISRGTPTLSSPSFSDSSSHVPRNFQSASVIDHNANNTVFSDSSASPHVSEPKSEELDHYLDMFFTEFCVQLPLVHRPTWTMAGKHPMLVSAMHVCGAIFVRSENALNFVRKTLVFLRDNLISEFSRSDCSLKDRFSLIVAVVLLQSLGLLWRQPDQSSTTKAFHGVLITMIRKLGLIKILGAWTPPDLSNPYTLDTAWREWARYETLKRVVLLAYVQDCSDAVFFSIAPLLHPSEMEIKLPCDESLWSAEDPKGWYQALHTPSVYGAGPRRLASISMQQAIASLDVSVPPEVQTQLNPFSHLILIHTILRNVFYPATSMSRTSHNGSPPSSNTVPVEYILHNWLQMWTHNSEGLISDRHHRDANASSSPPLHSFPTASSTTATTPFVSSSMPLYWLAHYSNVAIKEGLLDLRPVDSDGDAQERCRLISSWLNHINEYLDKGYQLPSRVQDFGGGNGVRFGETSMARHGGQDYYHDRGSPNTSPMGYL
ncbi:STE-12 alpha [Coprinopsis cinerea AmutBmut pab1-1]|nr:STE-12 alpha [Coprinopsis cinerea AmutBmut pab1-1]